MSKEFEFIKKSKMPFSLRLSSKGLFSASGSKRFEILPFSSGSLTPSIFSHYVRGISVFFVNLMGNSVFFTLCTSI
ncbi:hypothetical protein Hanom_Chr08g00693031 [Helianthus anomalus]